MATWVWSKSDLLAMVDDVAVTEFPDGDAVSCTLTGDDATMVMGCNGGAAACYRSVNVAEITIRVLSGSQDAERLMDVVDALRLARRGSVAVEIADGRGNSRVTISQAIIKKRPDVNFGDEAAAVEFVFSGVPEVYYAGGNELA
jgi:hypothetical protein